MMDAENASRAAFAPNAVERYHVLRNQIQHEDNLATQRLSYLVSRGMGLCALQVHSVLRARRKPRLRRDK